MPTYVYLCDECDVRFDAVRSMSDMDEPAECPDCGVVTTHRVFDASQQYSFMAVTLHDKFERNRKRHLKQRRERLRAQAASSKRGGDSNASNINLQHQ